MENSLKTQIGERIRNRREALGLMREQLAEQSGLSVQFFAEIELGKKNMIVPSLIKVATALNVTSDYIVFGTDDERSKSKTEELMASLSKQDRELAEGILENFVKAAKK